MTEHPQIAKAPERSVAAGSIASPSITKKKKKSGIPTGHAGEYFVMGELLRRGFDAQLADRNTAAYDVLVGPTKDAAQRKVQIKTVRAAPWYVTLADFKGDILDRTTIYVLLGKENSKKPVRFFMAKNRPVAEHVHQPPSFTSYGFMPIKALEQHENQWDVLFE